MLDAVPGFQFHYGTIKRQTVSEKWHYDKVISIPLWYD